MEVDGRMSPGGRDSPVQNEDDLFSDSDNEGGGDQRGGTNEGPGRGDRSGGSEEDEKEESRKKEEKKKKVKGPVRRQMISEEMLTGPNGLSKLPEIFKDFQFGGKARVKEDLNLMMSKLEHWVHLLHPKLPFDQCLQRIEFLGHKRKVIKTHIKKIRMNMIGDHDVITQDDDDDNMDIPEEHPETTLRGSPLPHDSHDETEHIERPLRASSPTLDDLIADEEDYEYEKAISGRATTTEEFLVDDQGEVVLAEKVPAKPNPPPEDETLNLSEFPDDDDDFLALCTDGEPQTEPVVDVSMNELVQE